MITADDALLRLKEGNTRFRAGDSHHIEVDALVRSQLVSDQTPFAIILGCSDSRVPAEIVFGQGVGDLFVIRVAGNVVAPSQIGSIEFAAEKFGTRLVVVLGHSKCGAVEATLEQLEQPTESRSPNLFAIVDRIRPSIEPLMNTSNSYTTAELMERAVRANIEASVENLRHGSEILESLIDKEELLIVGAEYCLDSGVVDFFDR
ncbi:MAG: carbonic anhydrase [SAR86 cluster bacterium]|uniref:carbonic anhydrase n=1 Tax=SAR86 cluster bacterium TaxID=2030880 RepID=A0A2A5BAP2_9GAMM|nr:MAG: carbonic anhydrase [SAR86 cluster bacterium]